MLSDYGIKFIRKCSQDQASLLKNVYDQHKPAQLENLNQIHWFNLFSNNVFNFKKTIDEQFHSFLQTVLHQMYGQQNKHIISYGYLYNPKNCGVNQEFHFDYDSQIQSLFITMIDHTTQNSTQFIKFVPSKQPLTGPKFRQKYGKNEMQLLQLSECDAIQIHQVICKAYSILHMKKGTIHRGIRNRGQKDRPLFFMHFSNKPINIEQNLLDLNNQKNQKFVQKS